MHLALATAILVTFGMTIVVELHAQGKLEFPPGRV